MGSTKRQSSAKIAVVKFPVRMYLPQCRPRNSPLLKNHFPISHKPANAGVHFSEGLKANAEGEPKTLCHSHSGSRTPCRALLTDAFFCSGTLPLQATPKVHPVVFGAQLRVSTYVVAYIYMYLFVMIRFFVHYIRMNNKKNIYIYIHITYIYMRLLSYFAFSDCPAAIPKVLLQDACNLRRSQSSPGGPKHVILR